MSRPNHTWVKALHTHKCTHIHVHTKPTNLPGKPASCYQQDWLGAGREAWMGGAVVQVQHPTAHIPNDLTLIKFDPRSQLKILYLHCKL